MDVDYDIYFTDKEKNGEHHVYRRDTPVVLVRTNILCKAKWFVCSVEFAFKSISSIETGGFDGYIRLDVHYVGVLEVLDALGQDHLDLGVLSSLPSSVGRTWIMTSAFFFSGSM